MQGVMHQLHASRWCDVDETGPDILSYAYDRVSEAGYMLQGGAGAIWRKVTHPGGFLCSLAAGMGFAPGEGRTVLQQCIRRLITQEERACKYVRLCRRISRSSIGMTTCGPSKNVWRPNSSGTSRCWNR